MKTVKIVNNKIIGQGTQVLDENNNQLPAVRGIKIDIGIDKANTASIEVLVQDIDVTAIFTELWCNYNGKRYRMVEVPA